MRHTHRWDLFSFELGLLRVLLQADGTTPNRMFDATLVRLHTSSPAVFAALRTKRD